MEKSQYSLCLEVLRRLESDGVLSDVILIGSWCMVFYKKYFSGYDYAPSIRTRDIDFFVPKPRVMRATTNLPEAMKDLGFIKGFRGREGYIILEHPELSIEFLVAEKGKGTDKPVLLPQLKMNAQALRFMELLAENTIQVNADGILVTVPHPANFALHKLIVAHRRRDKNKSTRDREAATLVLKNLVRKKEQNIFINVFNSVPKKWKQTIILELKIANEDKIIEILESGDGDPGKLKST